MAKVSTKKIKSLQKGFQKIPLLDIGMCQWNYKKFNDPDLQKKLVANIKKNGLIENLITYENNKGEILLANGNHRYLALQELKFEEADCYHLGKVSDAQAKRIAIETNETKFATDKDKLAELVGQISLEFDDFDETNPFDSKEMDALNALLDKDIIDDEDTPKKEKPKKSQTVMSAGGEKYTTVKMEMSPTLSERFNNALARFNYLEGNEKPLDIILQLVEKHSNEDILKLIGHAPKKSKAEIKRK